MTRGTTPDPQLEQPDPPRRRRLLGLVLTAVVAAALGAGGELGYLKAETAAPRPASASREPAAGIDLVGPVTKVGSRSITIASGPAHSVRAIVTSATRFTGTVHTLASVRVGDTVQAQIAITGATARVVSLQDPATVP
jgi:hypothetical protein